MVLEPKSGLMEIILSFEVLNLKLELARDSCIKHLHGSKELRSLIFYWVGVRFILCNFYRTSYLSFMISWSCVWVQNTIIFEFWSGME